MTRRTFPTVTIWRKTLIDGRAPPLLGSILESAGLISMEVLQSGHADEKSIDNVPGTPCVSDQAASHLNSECFLDEGRTTSNLPAPKLLREYEKILPGTAERLWSVQEKEQNHRHRIMDWLVRESQVRLYAASTIAITGIVGAIVLVALDKPVQGVAAIMAPMVVTVGIFLANRYVRLRRSIGLPVTPEPKRRNDQD